MNGFYIFRKIVTILLISYSFDSETPFEPISDSLNIEHVCKFHGHDHPQVPPSDEHEAGDVQEVAGEISPEGDDQVEMSEQDESRQRQVDQWC